MLSHHGDKTKFVGHLAGRMALICVTVSLCLAPPHATNSSILWDPLADHLDVCEARFWMN
jgi:hypothetical protein